MPSTYLALDSDQGPDRLVEVETATGRLLRVLVPSLPGGGVAQPSIPSDRSVIFYAQGLGTCAADVRVVKMNGTGAHVVVPASQADGAPSVRPDGAVLAFSQTTCMDTPTPHDVTQLVVVNASSGQQLSASSQVDRPASAQAWSSDGRRLLAFTSPGSLQQSSQQALHLLAVNAAGQITGDKALPSPKAGCYFGQALFSPATSHVIAQLACATGDSLVEIDSLNDAVVATLVPATQGQRHTLVAIDATGGFLIYGSFASHGNSEATWQVLAGKRSTTLATPSNVQPAAW